MVRVTLSYPNTPGSRFDMDYYLNKHTPLILEKLTQHGLTGVNIDQGIAGGMPGSPAQYQVQCFLNFPSLEQLQAGMASAGASLMSDLKNFTDLRPEIQISKVVR